MKKSILAAAVLLSLGTSAAQAVSVDLTTMAFYDAAGTPQFFAGGLNTGVVTTTSFGAAGTGAANSGTSPFFGTAWTADQAMWSEATGTATNWSGSSLSGAFNYDYTLAAGQVAVGISFTWGASSEIMVLQIFDCSNGIDCAGVTWDPAHGADGASHAVPGTAMANGPFTDQHATFAGVSAVPVPAAVWLFGSGLLGLVGVARRKKAA